jgi:UDP-N-acetylglucosamine acyltransferase
MSEQLISPLASVNPNAKIGPNVKIGPFCVIYDDVEIGEGTVLENSVTVFPGARIGKFCHIFPGACIATTPQDLKFKGEYTTAEIGDYTQIHECVTIHRATASKQVTHVGSHCLIMAYCHVAHDCYVSDGVIMSNCVQMAGEVVVEPNAVIGGGALIHQFTHIGAYCMIQGGAQINKDVPPYTMAARVPTVYVGLNTVGLRRHNIPAETILNIQEMYRIIYMTGLNVTHALDKVEAEFPQSPERDHILDFIRSSDRGILRSMIGS